MRLYPYSDAMNPVTLLSLGRIAVGVASIAKPDLVAKQMMGSAQDPPVLTQWFGNREIALGLVTLVARGGHRRTLVLAGMAVDGADAATAYSAMSIGFAGEEARDPRDRRGGRCRSRRASRPGRKQEAQESLISAIVSPGSCGHGHFVDEAVAHE